MDSVADSRNPQRFEDRYGDVWLTVSVVVSALALLMTLWSNASWLGWLGLLALGTGFGSLVVPAVTSFMDRQRGEPSFLSPQLRQVCLTLTLALLAYPVFWTTLWRVPNVEELLEDVREEKEKEEEISASKTEKANPARSYALASIERIMQAGISDDQITAEEKRQLEEEIDKILDEFKSTPPDKMPPPWKENTPAPLPDPPPQTGDLEGGSGGPSRIKIKSRTLKMILHLLSGNFSALVMEFLGLGGDVEVGEEILASLTSGQLVPQELLDLWMESLPSGYARQRATEIYGQLVEGIGKLAEAEKEQAVAEFRCAQWSTVTGETARQLARKLLCAGTACDTLAKDNLASSGGRFYFQSESERRHVRTMLDEMEPACWKETFAHYKVSQE
jgi:hypothetical protein